MQMRAMFVKDSHETPVLSLKWSLNAMKLFSGDSNGLVVCTEIEYDSVGCFQFQEWKVVTRTQAANNPDLKGAELFLLVYNKRTDA